MCRLFLSYFSANPLLTRPQSVLNPSLVRTLVSRHILNNFDHKGSKTFCIYNDKY